MTCSVPGVGPTKQKIYLEHVAGMLMGKKTPKEAHLGKKRGKTSIENWHPTMTHKTPGH